MIWKLVQFFILVLTVQICSQPFSTPETCAATLTWVMGQRYTQTSKIMPAGVVAGISALMTGFYLYKIATGGNHIPPKTE
ncbi:transmembrane proteins 14C [Actinidia rufa]|uniref:Transmembrane proteins 14C n=1 Tax=Actinidia rufa TaxID=165716 RepID=A0A7J0G296_9ERIC|nr:transmembrane proteins 14C [Actinidia rufa]